MRARGHPAIRTQRGIGAKRPQFNPLATPCTLRDPAAMMPDLVAPRADLAYYDQQRMTLPRPVSPADAWTRIMANPLPLLALAFRIRDAVASRFGVRRIGGFTGRRAENPKVGDRLDFFTVERSDANALTLTERDRHLDVMIAVTSEGCDLAITASVITHNRFGRLYMWPVGPAHRPIVRAMLRRLKRDLEQHP
ncbi:MAG: hypothetical protein RLZZ437_3216 [Pseudomonadota bacterium]